MEEPSLPPHPTAAPAAQSLVHKLTLVYYQQNSLGEKPALMEGGYYDGGYLGSVWDMSQCFQNSSGHCWGLGLQRQRQGLGSW